jgi:hypothetical protein
MYRWSHLLGRACGWAALWPVSPRPLEARSRCYCAIASLGQDKIAFLYADDVWTVSREGGEARRLTSVNSEFSREL